MNISFKIFALISLLTCILVLHIPNKAFPQNTTNQDSAQDHESVIHLYFPDKQGLFLSSEKISSEYPGKPVDIGKHIIKMLIKGPNEPLMRSIPKSANLIALYLTKEGTAYVDMTKEIKQAHPGGINSEIITIYSIVNSLILNIPEITAVKILINGSETLTLAGHVDIRYPFKANLLLVR